MTQINLPFQIGQIVEVKSFIRGYRGAWFRCKILDISNEKGELRYKFKYLDFPDEPLDNALVFETPKGGTESQLMLRPKYPPLYLESEYLNLESDNVEPLVVVHDSWKVGDLVDWLRDDIYWSGEIVEMRGRRACQIELLPKPEGEGDSYQGSCKNLRPRLDWSVEDGWKVPCTADGKKCAKIVTSKKEDGGIGDECETAKEQTKKTTKQVEGNEGILKPDVGEGAKCSWKYEDYRPSSSGM